MHLELFRRWSADGVHRALKTDCFEEAFGDDALLPSVLTSSRTWFAMDVSHRTVQKARQRGLDRACFLVSDARRLAIQSGRLDLVFSNSTLDHFESRDEFDASVREMARVLRQGGQLIITLDNPLNPLYWPLRWLSRTRYAPFPMGYTPSPSRLTRMLESAGFAVAARATLIHNPRLLSTAVCLILRRVLPGGADRAIGWLLSAFAVLERLPTRDITACFVAVRAVRCAASTRGSDSTH